MITRTATFTVEHGVTGGACPSGPAPFDPGFEAGTLNNQAGAYSPFQMHLTRGDGEQDMGRFSFKLPPGVVPRLAGIPYCPTRRSPRPHPPGPQGGRREGQPLLPGRLPDRPHRGRRGRRPQLTYVPGSLYLAGPYHGDPLSVVAITPAVAGPFDAGTVVVREALRVNPVSDRGEVDGSASDPIPHILKGIPLTSRPPRLPRPPQLHPQRDLLRAFEARRRSGGEGTALEPLPPTRSSAPARYQAAGCSGSASSRSSP